MKKILLISSMFLGLFVNASAQSFDVAPWNLISWDMDSTWLVFQGGSNPKGWFSFNLWPGVNNTMVVKDSPGANGSSFAAKITSRATPGLHAQLASIPRDTLGTLFTGTLSLDSTPPLQTGFPYNQRPTSLSFYSKYSPVGNDTASMLAYIFRQNGAVVDTIGKAVYIETASTSVYALHSVNFVYATTPPPAPDPADKLAIVVSSTRINQPTLGSTFYFDGVTDGFLGMPSLVSGNSRVFPNPGHDRLQIDCPTQYTTFRIFDIGGQMVLSGNIQKGSSSISIEALSDGAYFVRMESAQGIPLVHRFIKN